MLFGLDPDSDALLSHLEGMTDEDIERIALEKKAGRADIHSLAPIDKGEAPADHTKAVYEAAWGKTLETIKIKVARKQTLPAVVLAMLNRNNLTAGGQGNRVAARIVREIVDRMSVPKNSTNIPYARVGVANGRYTLIPNIDPVEMVSAHINPATKYIVELGSGRGNNLFLLHMLLGRETVRKVFFGLEYTDSGRELAATVASLDEKMQLRNHFFNYIEPDISMVPDDAPALFFSIHSIEQVQRISPKLYEQISARKAPTTVLHFEPVGWQRYERILARRIAKDERFLRAMILRRAENIDSEICQVINSAIHSWRSGYNENLLTIVRELEISGKFSVSDLVYDFSSHHPVNPTTYIKIVRPQDVVSAAASH